MSITHETVEIDVLMARMLIPRAPRAENIAPAIPGRSRKSGPKIETIATKVYGAEGVEYDIKARRQLDSYESHGYGELPICMAKTQTSFSTDPNLLGAPTGHVVPIREIRLAAGAEFIVVICGAIMTMPGLPRVPAANNIRVNDEGRIEGLF